MKKVYQTVIDKTIGNCMQATIASLLDLELNVVPNFILEPKNNWFQTMYRFLKDNGYEFNGTLYNIEDSRIRGEYHSSYMEHYNKIINSDNKDNNLERLKNSKGIDGFFYASVYSPRFVNLMDKHPTGHAVIIDSSFNIVHDPNPNYKDIIKYPYADELGYNGVIDVFLIEKKNDEEKIEN